MSERDDILTTIVRHKALEVGERAMRTPLREIAQRAAQASALEALAQSRGVDSASLIQEWIQENIQPSA
jgi:hypothetical protein